jgi:purine nucleosidase
MVKRILLDCDPGLDDALAIMLALGDPTLELVAITTVGGNVGLDRTTDNALKLREFFGAIEIPVAAGAAQPLVRAPENAAHVHGESGLGTVELPAAKLTIVDEHASDLIIRMLRDAPGDIHLVATGPLTNIALALQKEPRIVEWAASFVIMGGSYTRGNATPAAEFNIYADPEAASIVFAADWEVVMVGLDLTAQATATPAVLERFGALGPLATEVVIPLLTHWHDVDDPDWPGQAVHDVCAVAFISRPDLFESRPARVEIETTGEFTFGMTIVEFRPTAPNSLVPVSIDADGFWDLVYDAYERLAAAASQTAPSHATPSPLAP